MDLNLLETIVYGFVSGLAEILPVSARAHSILLLKLYGVQRTEGIRMLLIHMAVLAGLYAASRETMKKLTRAKALSRIPKRRRKRPLDEKSLMDYSFLRTMLLPLIPAYFLYNTVAPLGGKLIWLALVIFLNGVILYVPQFFPSSNKDSRSLSRLEGIAIGLGGALGILPGVSGMGTALSVSSICGVERGYALTMALMMGMAMTVGQMIFDVLGIITGGIGLLSGAILLEYIISAIAAFAGTWLGIRIMRVLSANSGYTVFSYYCWGIAIFAFILNLMA